MATSTTTAAAIRTRMIAVVKGLPPASDTHVAFTPSLNQREAPFRDECTQAPEACLRRFQIRDDGTRPRPRVTNTDVEEREVTFVIVVAYSQTNHWGAGGALERDRVMEEDEKQIVHNVGRDARANFTAPTYPDACWRSTDTRREQAAGVDFLVVTVTLAFFGSTT